MSPIELTLRATRMDSRRGVSTTRLGEITPLKLHLNKDSQGQRGEKPKRTPPLLKPVCGPQFSSAADPENLDTASDPSFN